MNLRNKNRKGGSCSINPITNVSNCVPNVNMSQYKCPCSFIPLDGYRHNIYPLSHNPPKLNTGGKKKTKKTRKTKKTKSRKINNRRKSNKRYNRH